MAQVEEEDSTPFRGWDNLDLRGVTLTSIQKRWLGMQIHEGSSTLVEMAKMYKLDQDLLQYYAELIDREKGIGTGLNIYPDPDDINYMHKIADEKGLIVSELTDEAIESLFNVAIAARKSGCLEDA